MPALTSPAQVVSDVEDAPLAAETATMGGAEARLVRLRLDLAYDGTNFSGWASQPGLRTVQSAVEDALATILRIPQTRLTVAGRTDAGVHARGQVCHADLPTDALDRHGGPAELSRRLSSLLPADLRVCRIEVAPAGFNARFSAIWRRYAYRVCDDAAAADPLNRHHVLAWPRRLDESAMNAAAQRLLGEHDFSAFCKRREGATTIRALRELSWSRNGNLLTATVVADAFCRSMVRSLVGCLVSVGEGRRSTEWPLEVLLALRRDPGVAVKPARGLVLEEVGYPADIELEARAREARALRTLR